MTPSLRKDTNDEVRRSARWFPGRAACLENSLAAALAALLTRRSVDWCIGARLMPYAAHAWIEVEGAPVGEPWEPDRPYLLLQRTRSPLLKGHDGR